MKEIGFLALINEQNSFLDLQLSVSNSPQMLKN
jgi:hypothetical protein